MTAEELTALRRMTFEQLDAKGRLPLRAKLAYAVPAFATTSLSFLIAVYCQDFYLDVGANLAFLSFFTALARSFDVITDPLMGWLSDRTRSRHGRRRPFMLTGCIFYCAMFVMLFSPPKPDDEGSLATAGSNQMAAYWFGVFYVLFYFSDTYCNVPYEALGPELTDSYEERNSLFFSAKTFNFLGMLIAAGLPAGLSSYLRPKTIIEDAPCFGGFDTGTLAPVGPAPASAAPPAYSQDLSELDPALGGINTTFWSLGWLETLGKADSSLELPAGEAYRLGDACAPLYTDSDAADGMVSRSTLCVGANGRFCYRQDVGEETFFYEVEPDALQEHCRGDALELGLDEAGSCGYPGAAGSTMALLNRTVEIFQYDTSNLDATRLAFQLTAIFFGAWYVLSIAGLVFTVKERETSQRQAAPVPLVPSVMRAFRNSAFRPLLMAWALDGLGLSALVSMFPFFIRYVIIPDGALAQSYGSAMEPRLCMGISVAALLVAALLSTPLWLAAANKWGKFPVWIFYNVVNIVTNLLFFIPKEGDPLYTIAVMAINGIPVGGQGLIQSVLADVIDYDEFLNGARSEASFSVFATLIPKFVAIPASAIPLAIINLLGFEQPVSGVSQTQTPAVKDFIRFSFILLPFLSCFIGFFIKYTFPIRDKDTSDKIAEGIAKHMKGEASVDPLTGKSISLLKLTPEEEGTVWYFENFSSKQLEGLLGEAGAGPIARSMFKSVCIGASVMALSFGLVIGFFSQLHDPKISIIPIMGVIAFGMSTCYTAVNYMRLKDARMLMDLQSDKDFRRLLAKVLEFKKTGARAGRSPLLVQISLAKDALAACFGKGAGRVSSAEGRKRTQAAASGGDGDEAPNK